MEGLVGWPQYTGFCCVCRSAPEAQRCVEVIAIGILPIIVGTTGSVSCLAKEARQRVSHLRPNQTITHAVSGIEFWL